MPNEAFAELKLQLLDVRSRPKKPHECDEDRDPCREREEPANDSNILQML